VILGLVSGTVVVAFGSFLIALAGLVFAAPTVARRFFMAFASSARTHYTEQVCRLLIGVSLVAYSPEMRQPNVFKLIGWAVVVSSAILLLLPWQWHHRFGQIVLPRLVRHMKLYAVGLFAFGVSLLVGVFS
jgi:hypothetical protein